MGNSASYSGKRQTSLRPIEGCEALPVARILRTGVEFSSFLSDRTLFFDGRFGYFSHYEGGDFFLTHDLIAVVAVCDGGHCEEQEGGWVVFLKQGSHASTYFFEVPKLSEPAVALRFL